MIKKDIEFALFWARHVLTTRVDDDSEICKEENLRVERLEREIESFQALNEKHRRDEGEKE